MPFAITPDPAYLYLSPRHQEALGHLLYGTGQYGGFVQLTGEVGTGKTTVVRTLLEQKLGEVDVAIVHNPRLDEREFVQSVCDELGVGYPAEASLKQLIDGLNRHLLTTHAAGRRTVLIIDEAQNLDRDVLEQVRLLTNLETAKEKLLRIMLIGQPELIDLLARPDLRQLASRITARFHLTPLSLTETGEYVRHRLRVAGSQDEIFPSAAVQEVYRLTHGVPRQINILCDRSMLGAYAQGLRRVTPEIVRKAASESLGIRETEVPAHRPRGLMQWVEIGVMAAAVLLALTLIYRTLFDGSDDPVDASPVASIAEPAMPPPTTAAPVPEEAAPIPVASEPAAMEDTAADEAYPGVDLTVLLQTTQPLPVVMSRLIRRWDADLRVPRGENVCAYLSGRSLDCYKGSGEWSDLRLQDKPAILSLTTGRGTLQHVLLLGLSDTEALVDSAQGPVRVALQDLDALWTGEFLLLWRRQIAEASLSPGMSGASIVWLRERLAERLDQPIAGSPSSQFDAQLREQVMAFQGLNGLSADGIVGVRTLLMLDTDPNDPHLEALSESAA